MVAKTTGPPQTSSADKWPSGAAAQPNVVSDPTQMRSLLN